jgi:hypothetical protein
MNGVGTSGRPVIRLTIAVFDEPIGLASAMQRLLDEQVVQASQLGRVIRSGSEIAIVDARADGAKYRVHARVVPAPDHQTFDFGALHRAWFDTEIEAQLAAGRTLLAVAPLDAAQSRRATLILLGERTRIVYTRDVGAAATASPQGIRPCLNALQRQRARAP